MDAQFVKFFAANPLGALVGSLQRLSGRFDREVLQASLVRHVQRWVLVYLLVTLVAVWFQAHYRLGVNVTHSLAYRLFLIHKGERPTRGAYVAFRWTGGGPYPTGAIFVKQLGGMPGDWVSRRDRDFFVNGQPMGRSKQTSETGLTLEPGPTGELPTGAYYVRSSHPDSLDSRYALTGWVTQGQIIGVAHVLF